MTIKKAHCFFEQSGTFKNALFAFWREIASGEDVANRGSALSAPPRNCDVMSLESAGKLWFAKETIPRLDGDLPIGEEVPFEEWFVSKIEQETK